MYPLMDLILKRKKVVTLLKDQKMSLTLLLEMMQLLLRIVIALVIRTAAMANGA